MTRPHEGLIRANPAEPVIKAEGDGKTLFGRFAAPGEWTEIRSAIEGHFMERFSESAFEKTIKESAAKMRVLFNHGLDPFFGSSVLGPIRSLDSDTSYEVELLDTDYNKRLIPQLESDLMGSSFKFNIIKEQADPRPDRSDYNPDGIPEVTISEARVLEFGPTPLPAYAGTSAGLRSLTDDFSKRGLPDDLWVALCLWAERNRAAALQDEKPVIATSSDLEPQHSAETDNEEGEEVRPSWFLT